MIIKMKKELYSHFIYINGFFKTSELKISTNDYLEINELSALGSVKYKIDLASSDLGIKYSKQKNYHNILIPILLLGCLFASIIQIAFTRNTEFLLPLISSILVIMSYTLIFFNVKTRKKYSLYKPSNNEVVYQIYLQSGLPNDEEVIEFVDELASRIHKGDNLGSIASININQNNTEDQYNSLIYNLESLYNSGVIDDDTFNRVESNINAKLYPNEGKKEKHNAEIIYLHNF